jgi:hypothetical protein
VTYSYPSDHAVVPFVLVQVPEVSGIQQPARKATRQLPKSGFCGSEHALPPPAPPAPLELVDDEEEEDVDEEDVDEEDVVAPCPPLPAVPLDDVEPPPPVDETEEPHAVQAAAIAAKRSHERRIEPSSMRNARAQASGEPGACAGGGARRRAPRRRLDA